MRIFSLTAIAALLSFSLVAIAQIKRTSVPIGDAVDKALLSSSLTAGGKPFHVLLTVSEPANPESPYQGSIEEWWFSADQWRREVSSKGGMHQTIVVAGGKKTERDEGDYYPLWLREFEIALLDPIPNANIWTQPGTMIQQTIHPNGVRSQACAKATSPVGTGDRAFILFLSLCFDDSGRVGLVVTPRYHMQFQDYQSFGQQQIARLLTQNPEPGTALVGVVEKLDDGANPGTGPDLFQPLSQDEDLFHTVPVASGQLEKLSAPNVPIAWPAVDHGSGKGHIAMYVSVDAQGQVREAWPLNADDAGLEDPAREQVRKWKFIPARDSAGHAVQIDGPMSFTFDTTVGPPPLHLNDSEMRALATKMKEPEWPNGSGRPGQTFQTEVSVDEHGKFAGVHFQQGPSVAQMAIYAALSKWTFKPLVLDGKPVYVHGTVIFKVR